MGRKGESLARLFWESRRLTGRPPGSLWAAWLVGLELQQKSDWTALESTRVWYLHPLPSHVAAEGNSPGNASSAPADSCTDLVNHSIYFSIFLSPKSGRNDANTVTTCKGPIKKMFSERVEITFKPKLDKCKSVF